MSPAPSPLAVASAANPNPGSSRSSSVERQRPSTPTTTNLSIPSPTDAKPTQRIPSPFAVPVSFAKGIFESGNSPNKNGNGRQRSSTLGTASPSASFSEQFKSNGSFSPFRDTATPGARTLQPGLNYTWTTSPTRQAPMAARQGIGLTASAPMAAFNAGPFRYRPPSSPPVMLNTSVGAASSTTGPYFLPGVSPSRTSTRSPSPSRLQNDMLVDESMIVHDGSPSVNGSSPLTFNARDATSFTGLDMLADGNGSAGAMSPIHGLSGSGQPNSLSFLALSPARIEVVPHFTTVHPAVGQRRRAQSELSSRRRQQLQPFIGPLPPPSFTSAANRTIDPFSLHIPDHILHLPSPIELELAEIQRMYLREQFRANQLELVLHDTRSTLQTLIHTSPQPQSSNTNNIFEPSAEPNARTSSQHQLIAPQPQELVALRQLYHHLFAHMSHVGTLERPESVVMQDQIVNLQHQVQWLESAVTQEQLLRHALMIQAQVGGTVVDQAAGENQLGRLEMENARLARENRAFAAALNAQVLASHAAAQVGDGVGTSGQTMREKALAEALEQALGIKNVSECPTAQLTTHLASWKTEQEQRIIRIMFPPTETADLSESARHIVPTNLEEAANTVAKHLNDLERALQSSSLDLSRTKQLLRRTRAASQSTIADLHKTVSATAEATAAEQERLSSVNDALLRLRQERDSMAAKLDDALKQEPILKMRITRLESKLATTEADLTAASEQLKNADAVAAGLRREAENMVQRCNEAESCASKVEGEGETLRQELAVAQGEVKRWKATADLAKLDVDGLKKKMLEQASELDKVSQELARVLKEQHHQARSLQPDLHSNNTNNTNNNTLGLEPEASRPLTDTSGPPPESPKVEAIASHFDAIAFKQLQLKYKESMIEKEKVEGELARVRSELRESHERVRKLRQAAEEAEAAHRSEAEAAAASHLSALETQRKMASEEVDRLQRALDDASKRTVDVRESTLVRQLQDKVASMRAERDELMDIIDRTNRDLESERKQLGSVVGEFQKAQSEAQAAMRGQASEIKQVKIQCEELHEKLGKASRAREQEAKEAKKMFEEAQAKVAPLEVRLREAEQGSKYTAELAASVQQLERQVEMEQQKHAALESARVAELREIEGVGKFLRDTIEQLNAQISGNQQSLEAAQSQLAQASAQLAQERQHSSRLGIELSAARDRVTALDASTTAKSSEIQSLQSQLDELQQQQGKTDLHYKVTEKMRSYAKTLSRRIEVLEQERQQLVTQLEETQAEGAALQEDLSLARGHVAMIEANIDQMNSDIEMLRTTNLELNEELAAARQEAQRVCVERDNLSEQVRSLQFELGSLRNYSDQDVGQSITMRQEKTTLRARNADLEHQLRDAQDASSSLEVKVRLATAALAEYQDVHVRIQDLCNVRASPRPALEPASLLDLVQRQFSKLEHAAEDAERLLDAVVARNKSQPASPAPPPALELSPALLAEAEDRAILKLGEDLARKDQEISQLKQAVSSLKAQQQSLHVNRPTTPKDLAPPQSPVLSINTSPAALQPTAPTSPNRDANAANNGFKSPRRPSSPLSPLLSAVIEDKHVIEDLQGKAARLQTQLGELSAQLHKAKSEKKKLHDAVHQLSVIVLGKESGANQDVLKAVQQVRSALASLGSSDSQQQIPLVELVKSSLTNPGSAAAASDSKLASQGGGAATVTAAAAAAAAPTAQAALSELADAVGLQQGTFDHSKLATDLASLVSLLRLNLEVGTKGSINDIKIALLDALETKAESRAIPSRAGDTCSATTQHPELLERLKRHLYATHLSDQQLLATLPAVILDATNIGQQLAQVTDQLLLTENSLANAVTERNAFESDYYALKSGWARLQSDLGLADMDRTGAHVEAVVDQVVALVHNGNSHVVDLTAQLESVSQQLAELDSAQGDLLTTVAAALHWDAQSPLDARVVSETIQKQAADLDSLKSKYRELKQIWADFTAAIASVLPSSSSSDDATVAVSNSRRSGKKQRSAADRHQQASQLVQAVQSAIEAGQESLSALQSLCGAASSDHDVARMASAIRTDLTAFTDVRARVLASSRTLGLNAPSDGNPVASVQSVIDFAQQANDSLRATRRDVDGAPSRIQTLASTIAVSRPSSPSAATRQPPLPASPARSISHSRPASPSVVGRCEICTSTLAQLRELNLKYQSLQSEYTRVVHFTHSLEDTVSRTEAACSDTLAAIQSFPLDANADSVHHLNALDRIADGITRMERNDRQAHEVLVAEVARLHALVHELQAEDASSARQTQDKLAEVQARLKRVVAKCCCGAASGSRPQTPTAPMRVKSPQVGQQQGGLQDVQVRGPSGVSKATEDALARTLRTLERL